MNSFLTEMYLLNSRRQRLIVHLKRELLNPFTEKVAKVKINKKKNLNFILYSFISVKEISPCESFPLPEMVTPQEFVHRLRSQNSTC